MQRVNPPSFLFREYRLRDLKMTRFPEVLRPRLTVKYVLCAVGCTYVFYCFLFNLPLFSSPLPKYTGQYGVGTVDVEVPVTERFTSETRLKATGEPAFKLETVLFSLYYPAQLGVKSRKPKHPWVSRPISMRAEGYAKFAHFNNFFSRNLFTFGVWGLVGGTKIPAAVDVPIHSSIAAHTSGLRKQPGNPTLPSHADKYPVIVFSHGDASSRTDYTHYAGELASRGYVVALIEHRDGSTAASLQIRPDGSRRGIYHRVLSEFDAEPQIDREQLKAEQIAFRQAEIEETIAVIQRLQEGEGEELYNSNTRDEGVDFKNWENRLDTNNLVIAGHSFGATGVLRALKDAPSKAIPAKGAVILDPGKSSGPLNTEITVPILIVHSNSWSKAHTIFYGSPHFGVVKNLVQDVLNRTGAAWFLTSLGTSHPSVTDAPLIEPLLLSWTTGATIDVYDGVREYVRVTHDFMRYMKEGKPSGLLELPVTHSEYGREIEGGADVAPDVKKFWEVHVAP